MAEAAAPQARLTWHAAPPADLTTALITQQAFALWPSFTPKPHHHKSGPPPDDTVDVQGAFGLVEQGGVRVAGVAVKIKRGTKVARAFGAGVKGTGGGLWWAGAHEGVQGFWTLWLLGADEADLVAVHRILLFLPPLPQQLNVIPPPDMTLARPRLLPTTRTLGPTNPIASLQSSFASIEGPKPEYRNSLLLVDEDTNEVIAILPLDSLKSPPPTQATFAEDGKALPPLPPTPATPAPVHQHSPSLDKELAIDPTRGQALADQVDEIVAHMSPGRRHKHAHRGDEKAQTFARERNGEDDGKRNGGRRSVKDKVCDGEGGIFLNLARKAPSQGSPTRSTRGGSVAEEDEEEMGRRTFDKLQHGFELLDAQVGTLDPYASPPFFPIPQPTARSKDPYESPPFSPIPIPSPRIRDSYESPPFMPEATESPSPAPDASGPYASPPLVPTSSSSRPLTFVDPVFSIPPTPTSIPLATILIADAPSFEQPQASHLRPGEECSIGSVSTLATLGTERRFATATEGLGGEESRRSSSATFTTAMEGGEELANDECAQDAEDPSPDLPDLPSHSQPQPRHAPSLSILSSAPSHALTPSNDNTNSVLLHFLDSTSTVTARLVSEDDIAREGLVPATVDVEEGKDGEGWGWWSLFSGWTVKESSWRNWLKGWWSTAPASDDSSTTDTPPQAPSPHPSATINAPTSYASNFFIPSFSTSSLASTPRPIPRSRLRRANGEATSRLSVVFYDDEGYGRAAYVDGAGGGFGPRGPVGGVGGGY